ncbi:hypothetical protein HQ544_05125 [Candidatus Falkowbacteria bacterium]|nr:hypothetical protein [Candidatus Falkowbacteria bacterium]
MENTKKRLKKIILYLKKTDGLGGVMLLETFLFIAAVVIMHSHGACDEHVVGGPGGCIKYVSFFEFYGYRYLYLVLNLALILGFFLFATWCRNKLGKKFSNYNQYKKVLIAEISYFIALAFILSLFFIMGYDGSSCILDNCVNVSLISFILFWSLSLFVILGLLSPIILLIIASPYLVVFLSNRFGKRKEKESMEKYK